MSIATLKRKTNSGGNPRNDPISGVGNKGFALNGTLRNIGGVGQFRMVSNVTRTRYRGNTPVGWGGSGGAYPVYIFNSGDCCTNDANIIKKSTKNTAAMIDERFKGILFGTYPNTWVKDDDNSYRITKTQGQYVGAVTNKVGSCNFSKPLCCNVDNTCTCTRGKYIYIGTKKKLFYHPTTKNVANFAPYGEMMSQGVYITAGGVAKKNNLPTPSCMQHYPPMLSHTGCNTNVITWQQAKAVGIMPPDYMECPPCDVNKCDVICAEFYNPPAPPYCPPISLNSIATEGPTNTWNTNSNVTILSCQTLTILAGQQLYIPINSGYTMTNNGTINIIGTLVVDATTTLINNGTINKTGTIVSSGTITNNIGGTINNNNGLINSGGGLTTNNGGTINNNAGGTIQSTGTINNNNSGTINNNTGGTINNFSGVINNNNSATITNNAGATINNTAGTFNNYVSNGATFTQNGIYTGVAVNNL